ncbi:tetratricopeptide repeat protein [Proteiniphilum sp. UBA1028]|jgi:hypothetical protein|uniref:tetratricopeptide repeat protein n=1 Tax=Proteiniphilum sp. UBA1028 TaxID=1947251 RepID=UPI000E862A67|nr:tetratricopeptide repeat protein [Proteiniphilum sp. UBA1028]HBG58555.1 hypothetical protein [Porphyromonadaceae bacterium]
MNKEELYRYIKNPGSLMESPADSLRETVSMYPYFHTSRLLYTKYLDLINSDNYNEELSTTAVLCTDRRKLFYLIYKDDYRRLFAQPEEAPHKAKDRTDELLNSFLSSLGEDDTHKTMIAETAMSIVSTDYLSYLESIEEDTGGEQEETQSLQHQEIIDAFIEKAATDTLFTPHDRQEEEAQKPAKEDDSSEFLTETLAKIYIKQKKYTQALTIIKRLSLNFPKKSSYFADQIRFLEYLIMNDRFR